MEKPTVPLSLLQLALPLQPQPPPPPAVAQDTLPQPGQHANQETQPVSVSIAPATVTLAAPPQPIQTAVVVVGSMEQVGSRIKGQISVVVFYQTHQHVVKGNTSRPPLAPTVIFLKMFYAFIF